MPAAAAPRARRNGAYASARLTGPAPGDTLASVQQNLLRVFIGLVVGNALLGSIVLLVGGLDGTGGKVFATSLAATAAMLVGIACSTGLRSGRLRVVAVAGVVATAGWLSLAVLGIWGDVSAGWVGQLTATLVLLAVVAAGVSLLGLATPAPRHRWLQVVALVLTALLTTAVITLIWFEDAAGDWFLRVTGVLAVGVAACTLVLPTLHRVAARERRAAAAGRVPVAYCPACGAAVVEPTSCGRCGASFTVLFAEAGGNALSASVER